MGDLVYLLDSATNIGQSEKLRSPWKGPYLIVKVLSNILFRICDHDRLKLYEGTEIPLWVRRARHNMEVANVIEDTPGEVTAGNSCPAVEQEQVVDEGDVQEGGKQTVEQRLPWVMLRERLWESRKLLLLKSEPAATAVFQSTFRILLWTNNLCAVSNYLSEFDRVVVSNDKCTKSVSALLHWKTLFTLGKHAGCIY